MPRASWDDYFMGIAKTVSERSTCDRKHVGAVIVRENVILSTGYNGSVRGESHCDDVGHLLEDSHCVRTVHAEANAIAQAAREGIALRGGAIYVTSSPCWPCQKLILNAGIWRIVYGSGYRDIMFQHISRETFLRRGMEVVDLSDPKKGTSSTSFVGDE